MTGWGNVYSDSNDDDRETNVTRMTEAQVLRSALDELQTHGWNQGGMTEGGKICAVGALYCGVVKEELGSSDLFFDAYGAVKMSPLSVTRRTLAEERYYELVDRVREVWDSAYTTLADKLQEITGNTSALPYVNDNPSTTLEDITLAFKHAIAAAEAKEEAR